MVKTSTSLKAVNYSSQKQSEMPADMAEKQSELFYNSIKPKLDQLIKEPSDEIIDKILAYSKKK
ncbi:MAG: hypothetical protein V4541_10160 [Bacteroidota bacterium]